MQVITSQMVLLLQIKHSNYPQSRSNMYKVYNTNAESSYYNSRQRNNDFEKERPKFKLHSNMSNSLNSFNKATAIPTSNETDKVSSSQIGLPIHKELAPNANFGGKRMPDSIKSSKISSNKSLGFVDRPASVHNNKPIHIKPSVDIGDDDSDIYEGEQVSFHKSEFDDDVSEQFVEVEEVQESIASSKNTNLIIKEAEAELESSGDNLRKDQSDRKPPQLHFAQTYKLDYLPFGNLTGKRRNFEKLGITPSNRQYHQRHNTTQKELYSNSIPHKTKRGDTDVGFTNEDKQSLPLPEIYYLHTNLESKNDSEFADFNSSVKIDNHKGDTDTLSQMLNQKNVSILHLYFWLKKLFHN